ncbi:MAG TPA: hypothetical protein VF739_14400 [Ktedonobacterales bacterium]
MNSSVRSSAPAAGPIAGPPIQGAPGMSGTLGASGAAGALPLWLPLPFLLTGVSAAALFGLLLPFILPQALLAPGGLRTLALTHVVTLGWLTMTIMGASLQLAPVILESPLRAIRFVRAQYPLYATGVALLILGFWVGRTQLLIAGGALVVAAIAHYVVIIGSTIAHAKKRPLSARYLAASATYLCVVVSLGLTAALNFQFGFLGPAVSRLLLTHITLGVVGWLTTTLMGVSYTLTRMFALVHDHSDALGRRIFVILNGGVIGLAAGFALGWDWLRVVGALALVAAAWLFAADYVRMLRARKRRAFDMTQRHAIAAVVYLSVAIPAGALVALIGADSVGGERALVALALAALVGWLGQSTIGYLYKIVPFLVWQSRYAPKVGRERVPLMRDLVHQRIAALSFWLINLALPATLFCALLDWTLAAQFTAAGLGVGLILAAANILGVLAPHAPTAPQSRGATTTGAPRNAGAPRLKVVE